MLGGKLKLGKVLNIFARIPKSNAYELMSFTLKIQWERSILSHIVHYIDFV